MALTRKQKEKAIKKLEDELSKMKSLVFIDYCGLKVKEIEELRKSLKNKNCKYLVAKKTLLKLVLEKLGLSKAIDLAKITGGVGLVFFAGDESALGGGLDEIEPARVVDVFAKSHKQLSIQGGFFNSSFISPETVKKLSKLPGRDQLIAQVVGTIKAPATGMVWALKANLKNLVYIISQIKSS